MKIYAPPEGFTKAEMDRGMWALYADVKCTNRECGKEISLANTELGQKCPKCGSQCL